MSDAAPRPLLRPARSEDRDEVVPLLYETAGPVYGRFAGSRRAAIAILRAAYRQPGNTASAEVVTVAELDGRIAGAMSTFPVGEGVRRAQRYLALSLRRLPPWRWPRAWRIFHGVRPVPPPRALYVDALATGEAFRRRGVAATLLDAAAADARERGCTHLALETELDNSSARALYHACGFEETDRLPPAEPDLGQGYVCLVRPLEPGAG